MRIIHEVSGSYFSNFLMKLGVKGKDTNIRKVAKGILLQT
jgi:hypothetical protein